MKNKELAPIATAMLMLVDDLTHEQRYKLVTTVFPKMTTFTARDTVRLEHTLHNMDSSLDMCAGIFDGSSGVGALGAQQVNSQLKAIRSNIQLIRNMMEGK